MVPALPLLVAGAALAVAELSGVRAPTRIARQPVVRQRIPHCRARRELVPLRADPGVAVDRAEAHGEPVEPSGPRA